MWLISLIGSLIVLGILVSAIKSGRYTRKEILQCTYWIGLVVSVGPLALMLVLPPLIVQAVLLILVALVGYACAWKPRLILLLFFVATGAAFGIVFGLAVLETQALRAQYPIVSMADVLPEPQRAKSLSL